MSEWLSAGYDLGECIRAFCAARGIRFRNEQEDYAADARPILTGQNYLLALQQEALGHRAAAGELTTEEGIKSAAQRLWTSALTLRTDDATGTEFCRSK